MRDLFKNAITGSMIAGAALLVAACSGGNDTEANNMSANMTAEDPLMNELGNDVTTMDATGNMGMSDTGMTNSSGTTDTGMTNSSGTTGTTGNTTGGDTGGNTTGGNTVGM